MNDIIIDLESIDDIQLAPSLLDEDYGETKIQTKCDCEFDELQNSQKSTQ